MASDLLLEFAKKAPGPQVGHPRCFHKYRAALVETQGNEARKVDASAFRTCCIRSDTDCIDPRRICRQWYNVVRGEKPRVSFGWDRVRRRELRDCSETPVDDGGVFFARRALRLDWFVYLLQCADQSIYTGITTDLNRRMLEHNSGKKGAKYTRSRRPVELVWMRPCRSQGEALRLEMRIKRMSRTEKIKMVSLCV